MDRGCAEVLDTPDNTCKAVAPPLINLSKCDRCDKDLCNSASGVFYSLATIGLAIIVVLNV